VENASVLEPKTMSYGWAVQNSWNSGVKSRGEAILSFVTRAFCKRLSCNGWAEPYNVNIKPWYCCLSLKALRVDEVVLGFLLQGLGQGLDDKQSYMHPVKCGGAKGWWCRSIFHFPSMPYTHVTSGRFWNLGSVRFVSQSSACGG